MSFAVAPLVGAWIEIWNTVGPIIERVVAPLVGAWIEIPITPSIIPGKSVAPLVGAWIEISKVSSNIIRPFGRSSRGSVD